MSGPGRNVGATERKERGTGKMKKKCEHIDQIFLRECKKDAVIIENKKYYCADCYIDKFIGMYKRLRFKSVDDRSKSIDKGWNRV
jgi:hypothetical protein|tara:strand:+ start:350 stop:604 length:255 start_codon:yes stop_codon:yes gene_type:complete